MVCGCFFTARAQFESSSPSIPKQEYFNPAFNAYKTYGSLNMMQRSQWVNKNAFTPKMFATNIFIPTKKQGLGFGGTLVSEDIGLRTKNTFLVSVSQGVRIGYNSYLAIGIGLGVEIESYQKSKMRYYPEVSFNNVKLNSTRSVISLGAMALLRNYFVGISTNLRVNDQDFDFTYLTGFDVCAGRVYILNPDYVFRSTIVAKYYKETRYNVDKKMIEEQFVPPVIDWSLSCLFYNKMWVSAGLRFNQAATIMVSYRINKLISLGVKYEPGLGSGYNRYNSQGIYLTYNFGKRNSRGLLRKGVFSRSSRVNNPLNEYMY